MVEIEMRPNGCLLQKDGMGQTIGMGAGSCRGSRKDRSDAEMDDDNMQIRWSWQIKRNRGGMDENQKTEVCASQQSLALLARTG